MYAQFTCPMSRFKLQGSMGRYYNPAINTGKQSNFLKTLLQSSICTLLVTQRAIGRDKCLYCLFSWCAPWPVCDTRTPDRPPPASGVPGSPSDAVIRVFVIACLLAVVRVQIGKVIQQPRTKRHELDFTKCSGIYPTESKPAPLLADRPRRRQTRDCLTLKPARPKTNGLDRHLQTQVATESTERLLDPYQ